MLKIACDLEIVMTLTIMLALKSASGDSSKNNLGVSQEAFGVSLVLVSTVLPIPALAGSLIQVCITLSGKDSDEKKQREQAPADIEVAPHAVVDSRKANEQSGSEKDDLLGTRQPPPAQPTPQRATTPPRSAGSPAVGVAVKAVVKAKRGAARSPAGGGSPSRSRVRATAKPASTTRP